MYSCSGRLCLGILWIAIGSSLCSSSWDQLKFVHHSTVSPSPEPTFTYAWVIPPQIEHRSISQTSLSSKYEPRIALPLSPSPSPVAGYGHPSLNRRYSHEQLTLPNEFLIKPGDAQQRLTPQPIADDLNKLFMELGVWGDPKATCQNVDNNQQSRIMQQSNIAPVSTIPDYQQRRFSVGTATTTTTTTTAIGQHVNKPSSHGGGFGLLFFVPQSASHLPAEQLIHQQLAKHRTLFPFDISINCKDGTGSACQLGGTLPPPPSQTIDFNGRNVENVNYASLPLVESVNSNSRSQQQRKWRTLGKRILHNQQQQKQQQQDQLQQNQ